MRPSDGTYKSRSRSGKPSQKSSWSSLSLGQRFQTVLQQFYVDWHAWNEWDQKIIAQAKGLERVQRAQVQGQEGFDDQVNCQGTFTR